jgi:hypothetical protein
MTSLKRFGMLWLVAVAFSSFAQFVSVTPKIGNGLSLYKAHYNDKVIGFNRTSPHFGVATEYRLTDKHYLKAELLFDQERSVLAYNPGISSGSSSKERFIFRSNFLALPLYFQKNFGKNGNGFWNVGIYTAYQLGQSSVYKGGGQKMIFRDELDSRRQSRFFGGLSAGVGLKLPVTERNKVVLELKSNYSINGSREYWDVWLQLGFEFGRKKA